MDGWMGQTDALKTEKLVLGAIDWNNESYKLVEIFDAESVL